MNYQIIKPSPVLSPFIKYYWVLEVDNISIAPEKQRVFPLGCIEIFFYYGDKFQLIDKNNEIEILPRSIISGQKTEYFDILPKGKIGLLSVMFTPIGARMFFNVKLTELKNKNIDLELVIGKSAKILEDQIFHAPDNQHRIKLIEDFLYKQILEHKYYDFNRLSNTITGINQSGGQVSVKDLSDIACLSVKQFERKFSEFVGLTPNKFIRIIRLLRAINTYQGKKSTLTSIALECGYYDQAHFTNDFKTLTGYTPKDFFRLSPDFSDNY